MQNYQMLFVRMKKNQKKPTVNTRVRNAHPALASAACSPSLERAEAIIKDILVNHLPRIEEGLRAGYVDENQILVMYDHAVRARILRETATEND